jgi:hypothetical protein
MSFDVQPLSVELGDWPGGHLSAMECVFPEAPDGGIDLALPAHCHTHNRTIWWCPNAGVMWCDGGPQQWAWHPWPMEDRDLWKEMEAE